MVEIDDLPNVRSGQMLMSEASPCLRGLRNLYACLVTF